VVFQQPGLLQLALPGVDLLAGLGTMDLDAEMAERVTRHEIGGILVPVIPPEDNILLKAMLGRGAEVGKHDWEDVEAMMAFVPSLDWAYLRWRAGTLDNPEKVEAALARVERIWQQRQKTEEETGEQD
jgi:predicted nucleotidyltransferase